MVFIFLILLLGNIATVFSLHGMQKILKTQQTYNKFNKTHKIVDTRYYKKYKNINIDREKYKNYFIDAVLCGLGIIAFEDIYNNHLEIIANTAIIDFLETE